MSTVSSMRGLLVVMTPHPRKSMSFATMILVVNGSWRATFIWASDITADRNRALGIVTEEGSTEGVSSIHSSIDARIFTSFAALGIGTRLDIQIHDNQQIKIAMTVHVASHYRELFKCACEDGLAPI